MTKIPLLQNIKDQNIKQKQILYIVTLITQYVIFLI